MKNPITTLHIQNFKTIKDLKVKCKRINIIIGKPNVGKSNFLEALSLLGCMFSASIEKEKFMGDFIRYNLFEDLFYDKETEHPLIVNTNIGNAFIKHLSDGESFEFYLFQNEEYISELLEGDIYPRLADIVPKSPPEWNHLLINIDEYGCRKKPNGDIRFGKMVKKYEFLKDIKSTNRFHEFLLPPYGENIFTIVNRDKGLLKEIGNFFKEYKLKFGLRMSDTSFEVIKQVGNYVYSTSYNLIADTLQRIIFNIAAIHSNKESILLFEEPEAHSFPLYAQKFADKVIESKTNQFFITTHSPFILNTIIEKSALEDVAIFIASYDKFQTKLTELTEDQIRGMLDYGNDIFFSPQVLG